MKKFLFIISIISIINGCTVQNNIKKVEIKETGYNINVVYDPINDEISEDGVSYKIIPVSPDELNSFFIKENTYNGKINYSQYETSRESYFLVSSVSKPSFELKSQYDFLHAGLEWLLDNEIISRSEYNATAKNIDDYYLKNEETQNEEVVQRKDELNRFIIANPYYIGDEYFNVFKVEISNNTDVNKILHGNFSVNVGDQLLQSLSNDKIIELLRFNSLYNQDKHKNLERYNLSTPLVIPPQSNFTKYFSVLPFDYNNNSIDVSTHGVSEKASWDIKTDKQTISELYTFYVFDIEYLYNDVESYTLNKRFNLVTQGSNYAIMDKNEIYIDEDHLGTEIEIFTITIFNNRIYYGRNKIQPTKSVNIDSNIRYPITIKLERIKELKL